MPSRNRFGQYLIILGTSTTEIQRYSEVKQLLTAMSIISLSHSAYQDRCSMSLQLRKGS